MMMVDLLEREWLTILFKTILDQNTGLRIVWGLGIGPNPQL